MFEYLQNRKGHRGIPAHRVLSGVCSSNTNSLSPRTSHVVYNRININSVLEIIIFSQFYNLGGQANRLVGPLY